jgi:FkbM family methyltransferase
MPSILYIRRMWNLLNPRAIIWWYIKKRYPNKPIITKLGKDLKVRIYTHDVIGKDIYVNGMFEKAESKFVMRFLKPGMVFFDVGANLGQYTLLAARHVGPAGQVHSFEPSGRMFTELKYNVELNCLTNMCRLNKVAVSNNEGIARLSMYEPGAEVYGSLGCHRREEGKIIVIGYEEVKTIRLDDYVKEFAINRIDLIKMDIEGAEFLALQGGERVLSRTEAPAIVLEMADINTRGFRYPAIEIWNYLESHAYRMYCLDKRGCISGLAQKPADFSRAQNLVGIKGPNVPT